jgi:hypothetical protein
VWKVHYGPDVTNILTEPCGFVVFSDLGKRAWKPLDRASVETLVGRSLS